MSERGWREEDKEHEAGMGGSRQRWDRRFTFCGTGSLSLQSMSSDQPFSPPSSPSVNWNSVRWLLVQHWNEIKDVKALIVFKDWSTLILRKCFGGGGWALGPCGCIHVIWDSWTLWWSLQYFDVYETFVNTLYTVLAVWSKLKLWWTLWSPR